MDIQKWLQSMVQRQASDMFLSVHSTPCVRVNGKIERLTEETLSADDMWKIVQRLLTDERKKKQLQENMGADFIHVVDGLGRFRVNVFIQRGTPALVARHVRGETRNFLELNLPAEVLTKLCEECSGMVLLCGPAGSGKSTTIASMLDLINETQQKHIVTIEDPIEFLFTHKKSVINQRELDSDVLSYADALKHVTQQSPDIIYIGNIRDVDTMRAAITATELGAFVVSTFHTINAVQTLTRIVNFFPPYQHEEIFLQLSAVLKAVVALRLLPRSDGSGRIPACETMVVTPTVARLIREGKVNEIQQFIDEGDLFGMQSFKQALVQLVKAGLVTEEDARMRADSRSEFDLEMKGIRRVAD